MLIDTHCHLGDEQFERDRSDVVARARAATVGHVIVIADSVASTAQAVSIAHEFGLSASAGVHPHVASSWSPAAAGAVRAALDEEVVVAVGETGLDYHYDHSPRAEQRAAFAAQLTLAARFKFPVVVHSRSADEDMIAMLRDAEATIVLHSFSSGTRLLELALERRHYVSFSGMVTFRSWKDAAAVRAVAADRLLVETDAPYLAPAPHRGSRNEPAYVTEVVRKVAEMRAVPVDEVVTATTANAERCFGKRVTLTEMGKGR